MHYRIGAGAAGAMMAAVAVAGCSSAPQPPATIPGAPLGAQTTQSAQPGPSAQPSGPAQPAQPTGPTQPASPAAQALQAVLTAAGGRNTAQVSESVKSSGTTMRITGVQQSAPVGVSMNVTATGTQPSTGSMSVIFDGSDVYVKSQAMTLLDGGKPWARYGPSVLGSTSAAGTTLQLLEQSATYASPLSSTELLLASGGVQKLGTGTVAGRSATQYGGTLTQADIASLAAVDGLTAGQAQQIRQMDVAVTSEGIDVWIGSDSLPVEIRTIAQTSAGAITTVVDYSGWGSAASVGDPPSDQVAGQSTPAV